MEVSGFIIRRSAYLLQLSRLILFRRHIICKISRMKQTIIAIGTLVLLSSCTQVAGWFGTSKDSTAVQTSDSLNSEMIRDESITEANAYSDLFLDSSAIENYISREKLNADEASMMRNFYAVRNNQFAWFATDGPTEQARGLWSLYANETDTASKNVDRKLKDKMDTLLQSDSVFVTKSDSSFVQTELALTRELIQYAGSNTNSAINRNTLYYLVPVKKQDPMQLADSLLNKQKDSTQFAGNTAYAQMKQQLSVYYNLAKNGGWDSLSGVQKLKKGATSPAVTLLKKRMAMTGDYITGDTTAVFSDSLVSAVRDFQSRNGLLASGVVNDSMVHLLNVPVTERMQQILLNMNRMIWMRPMNDSNRVQVNIPSQMLYTYEGGNKLFEMPVIVGKEGTGTVMFNGNINQIVFNPYWNIPSSIVKNEIAPAMKSDPGYLKKHNMEIVKQNDSLPEIRQLPGKDNALGKVKFLFPNTFDIYLHDTPDKTLFKKQDRALSHGCIRVADAAKMAEYLLRDQPEWNAQKINQAMNSGKEQSVSVKKSVPVYITYYTAWIDEKGKMNFRNDVYGHDKDAAQKMFAARS
jgi:murein L,D-transpeptidase YcbB/YkuD